MAQIQLERRMTESERHEKIMDFIRKHPRERNKADVMRFMADNGFGTNYLQRFNIPDWKRPHNCPER